MNQMKIGAFISERRKAKGWMQSQLAEKLDTTPNMTNPRLYRTTKEIKA